MRVTNSSKHILWIYFPQTLHISDHVVSSPETKEVDFFKEHHDDPSLSIPVSRFPQQQDMNLSSSPPEVEVKVQPDKNGQEATIEGCCLFNISI